MSDFETTPKHSPAEPPTPYWRLSSFYFWYFALLGALYPYWSLYFQSLSLSPEQIGALMAAMMGTKIVAPNLWAWLADFSGKGLLIMRIGAVLGMAFFCGFFITDQFVWLWWVIVGFSFFWNAILPQFEAITLSFLAARPERYSQIRLWGSVGFIAAVVGIGWWFEQSSLSDLPVIGVTLLLLISLSSLSIPARKVRSKSRSTKGFWQLLLQPSVIAFLLAGFFMQMAHGAYYSFFSIHLESLGYSRLSVGLIWALGVVAEVLIFLVMHRLLPRLGIKLLMVLSLGLAAIRWQLIGHLADELIWLLIAQTFHAFTFGTFHSAAIEGVRQIFGEHHQGKGQALYGAFTFGAGGAVGSVISGWAWQVRPILAFEIATVVSVMGFLIILFWFKEGRVKSPI